MLIWIIFFILFRNIIQFKDHCYNRERIMFTLRLETENVYGETYFSDKAEFCNWS